MSNQANLKCPFCKTNQNVAIPENNCLSFHDCSTCEKRISVPKESKNCCVVCEYGDRKCPIPNVKNSEKKSIKYKIEKWFGIGGPVLGAGVIAVCPLCWVGSASLLTYLGLGALIPGWQWLGFSLWGIGIIGFALDYRFHKNIAPLILLLIGGSLLYYGRYVSGITLIWALSVPIILGAVVYNRRLFK